MKQGRYSRSSLLLLICAFCAGAGLIALLPLEALARVGGGQSYGGGGSHGGGGGDGAAGAIIWVLFQLIRLTIEEPAIGIPLDIIVIGGLIVYFFKRDRTVESGLLSVFPTGAGAAAASGAINTTRAFDQLRRFDPNFSEIIFTDFCYALYAKAHDARGHSAAALDLFSPYLDQAARSSLMQRNPPTLQEVKGIIVGAMTVADVRGLDGPVVNISVMFEANYTEVNKSNGQGQSEMSYYVRERWDLERKRDVLSPPPAQATALHCPRCGAPLQKDTVGACAFCLTKIDSGEFQWYVRSITLLNRAERGPLL